MDILIGQLLSPLPIHCNTTLYLKNQSRKIPPKLQVTLMPMQRNLLYLPPVDSSLRSLILLLLFIKSNRQQLQQDKDVYVIYYHSFSRTVPILHVQPLPTSTPLLTSCLFVVALLPLYQKGLQWKITSGIPKLSQFKNAPV